jgi:transposase InsO family protein
MSSVRTGYAAGFTYATLKVSRALYNVASNVTNEMLTLNSPAVLREQILVFFAQYGLQASIDAYHVSKATIYRWRKLYLTSYKEPASLIPKSRAPINRRTMRVNYRIVDFIKDIRKERGRIGKEKIKPLLDEFCRSNATNSISQSKIGRVISKFNLYNAPARVYHNGRAKAYRRYKEKIKHAPKPSSFGYVEIDTIARFNLGIKTYIFNAIDVKLKFQFSYAYRSNSSANAADFFNKFQEIYPIPNGIKTVQTDNGSEYLGVFAALLKQKKIPQIFIYPRCPKINGCVERANRSLQEEFVDRKQDLLVYGLERFNSALMEHLIWYNTKRVHKALGNRTPIDYLLTLLPESHMYWTRTLS